MLTCLSILAFTSQGCVTRDSSSPGVRASDFIGTWRNESVTSRNGYWHVEIRDDGTATFGSAGHGSLFVATEATWTVEAGIMRLSAIVPQDGKSVDTTNAPATSTWPFGEIEMHSDGRVFWEYERVTRGDSGPEPGVVFRVERKRVESVPHKKHNGMR